jgi:hypothetical protein
VSFFDRRRNPKTTSGIVSGARKRHPTSIFDVLDMLQG